jgi:hypothetical protein
MNQYHQQLTNPIDMKTFTVLLKSIILTAVLFFPVAGIAQTTFSQEGVISTTQAEGVNDLLLLNVDGQGELDIITSNSGSNGIFYFQNLGNMDFNTGLSVTTNISGLTNITGGRVDDSGIDIYSGSQSGIGVHDNSGSGNFSFSVIQKSFNNAYNFPESLSLTDIDDDGNVDLLFVEPINSVTSNIHIIFTVESTLATSYQQLSVSGVSDLVARDVISGDVDGDGRLDLVIGSSRTADLHWVKNNGNRNFGAPSEINSFMTGFRKVLGSDFDKDGDLDLFVLRNDRLVLIKNNGAGNFATSTTLTFTSSASDLAIGDLDNDDFVDVVMSSSSNIIWIPNDQSGEFGTVGTISNSGASTIAIGDLRGDGDLDVVAGVTSENKIVVFENFKLGPTNQPPVANDDSYSTDQNVQLTVSGAEGVLSNDSDPEGSNLSIALESDVSNGTLSLGGNGSFTYTPNDGFFGEDSFIYSVTDTEGAKAEATVTITVNEGPANEFPVASNDSYSTGQGESISVSAEEGVLSNDTDPDGDELTVRLVTDVNNGTLELLADGSFTYTPDEEYFGEDSFTYSVTDELGASDEATVTITISFFLFSEPVDVVGDLPRNLTVFTADLDGDGFADVLTGSGNNGEIIWVKNNGDGTFGQRQLISSDVPNLYTSHAADLDGDGDIDVLSASRGNSLVAWYENDGSGNFGAANTIHSGGTPTYIHAADLDGDEDQDVMIATVGSDQVLIYMNEGGGSFDSGTNISNQSNPTSVIADDIDGDGDLDVIFSANQFSKVLWAENNGDGSFAANAELTRKADGVWGIHSIDMDGDGDIDVLSASETDNKIAWYRNRGNTDPRFSRPVQNVISDTFTGARDVTAGDVDMDGDVDVIGAALGANKVSLFLNNGSQSFEEVILSSNADGASHVVLEDMDNDGDLDILAATQNSGKVMFFENIKIDTDDAVSIEEEGVNLHSYVLLQNYPNPFNPSTNIGFQLPEASEVTLKVYDMLGREVAALLTNAQMSTGAHTVTFDASNLPSGIYLYQLEAGELSQTRKMSLIK